MQILCGPPFYPPTILTEMVHDQPDVIEVAKTCLRVPEPEAVGKLPHQSLGPSPQFGGRRVPFGDGNGLRKVLSHGGSLLSREARRNLCISASAIPK